MKALLCCLALAASVAADVRLESLVVSPSAPRFQLNLRNDGRVAVTPDRIELRIRESDQASWQSLKLWVGPRSVPPGAIMTLESTPYDGGPALEALSLPSYQLQAVVSGPDVPKSTFNYIYGSRSSSSRNL